MYLLVGVEWALVPQSHWIGPLARHPRIHAHGRRITMDHFHATLLTRNSLICFPQQAKKSKKTFDGTMVQEHLHPRLSQKNVSQGTRFLFMLTMIFLPIMRSVYFS